MSKIIVKLAGVTVGDAQANIKRFGCADIGSYALIREPNNEHDPNAIRVVLGNFYIGYIPRDVAKDLAPRMDRGERFLAMFVKRNEPNVPGGRVGLTVEIVKVAGVGDPIVQGD